MNFFYYDESVQYPSPPFSPHFNYPEYLFNDLNDLQSSNTVYDMIRNSMILASLDLKNQGLETWNPLGDFIKEGDTVLIKPNLVNHINYAETDSLDALVTHPSVIRCIIDYVIIALRGTGKIILGDAPVQECNFEKLLEKGNYKELINFYLKQGIVLDFEDFREVSTIKTDGKFIQNPRKSKFPGIEINLKQNSFFNNKENKNFRITNYNCSEMQKYHNHKDNVYCISQAMLQADVIINLPKPKTHRYAAFTGALKNLIGVNSQKKYLPHYTKAFGKQLGDEYVTSSLSKSFASNCLDLKNELVSVSYNKLAWLLNIMIKANYKLFNKDNIAFGTWYGNDTIWRTILDINKIALYANKRGQICEDKQRKILTIGDMIISGEGEGPLAPTSKKTNAILISDDSLEFDLILASLMGFDYKKIPVLNEPLKSVDIRFENITLNSNSEKFNQLLINVPNFHFCCSEGWKNIELEI